MHLLAINTARSSLDACTYDPAYLFLQIDLFLFSRNLAAGKQNDDLLFK